MEDLTSKKHVVTVAGGKSKGQAIISYFKNGKSDVLITDEAAAEQILRDVSL
ncbi:sugar-binding domain-containing protein [Virgibacillus soli]|uniref:Sugar-binding domain-containing protein n=1 Tax=Paracerasibacillus soli TaxID=480284 RepID=A0ABU5CRJ6_9BACI|nr:sugar-binding domain-containing protein [Virgibacillus soli]MDY0408860.1 sugar-binding domain-containing protein [Virgibacillus soli]